MFWIPINPKGASWATLPKFVKANAASFDPALNLLKPTPLIAFLVPANWASVALIALFNSNILENGSYFNHHNFLELDI